jgi:NAD(P)-binding Rossmann-like domain
MSEAVTQSIRERIPTAEELGFDPGLLREKYAAERSRRLRADGNDQYREIAGRFEHYNADPYVAPGFTRAALQEELDVVINGGGFGGMLAAVRLQEAGITNFRIVEKAGDFGGTWYWNRYPGAQCDVEGYLYLPLAGRDRLHPEGEVLLRARDLRPRPTDWQTFQSLRKGLLPDEDQGSALGR